jgi:hypothetical protein
MFVTKWEIERDGISEFLIETDIAQQVRPALHPGAVSWLRCRQAHAAWDNDPDNNEAEISRQFSVSAGPEEEFPSRGAVSAA